MTMNDMMAEIRDANLSYLMLARFRFDDSAILSMLTSHTKDRSLAQSHAAILMAGQPVEEIV